MAKQVRLQNITHAIVQAKGTQASNNFSVLIELIIIIAVHKLNCTLNNNIIVSICKLIQS